MLSPQMLNIAFIILNDFLKLEGLKPTCSFVLENILDCEYQVLDVGMTNRDFNWIEKLKQDKLTLCAVQQLCEIFKSNNGRCLVLRAKETSLTLPSPTHNNQPRTSTPPEDPNHIEVLNRELTLPPPANIEC